MKSMKLFACLLMSCILFTACAPAASFMSNASRVQTGHTENDVIAIMGCPQQSQSNGLLTAWQYCVTDSFSAVGTYQVVAFDDGIVYYTSSYSNPIRSTCEAHFSTIDWQDEPDVSIEVQ
jgi:hypothetical protein